MAGYVCDCRDPTAHDVSHDDCNTNRFIDANRMEKHTRYYAEAKSH